VVFLEVEGLGVTIERLGPEQVAQLGPETTNGGPSWLYSTILRAAKFIADIPHAPCRYQSKVLDHAIRQRRKWLPSGAAEGIVEASAASLAYLAALRVASTRLRRHPISNREISMVEYLLGIGVRTQKPGERIPAPPS
jgi:hypothetical protein